MVRYEMQSGIEQSINLGSTMNVFQNAITNWPEDEAKAESEFILDPENDMSKDEKHQWIIRTRRHWVHVFDDTELMNRFTAEFNRLAFSKLNIAI